MKLFQLTIPKEKHSLIVQLLQDELELDNVTSVEARTSSIISFRVEDIEMQGILTTLQSLGVGIEFGFCDVMSLTPGTTIHTAKVTESRRRLGRLLKRSADVGTALPVAEMYAHIESNATLSRDSVGMLLISSTIAGIGLAADSPTYLVASMLLSPLMGPILGCAFGYAIRDRQLLIDGLKNELMALLITLLLGFIIGAGLAPYAGMLKWPTNEMRSRGQMIQIIFGAAVAALSGTAVALAESNANISSVVGTAIAAALLPPTVNCGICLAYAIVGEYFITKEVVIGEAERVIFYEIAAGSALLVWINIIFIYLFAVLMFRIKRVERFQMIRRVDHQMWQNLPKVLQTPKHSKNEKSCRFANFEHTTSLGDSSHGSNDDQSPSPNGRKARATNMTRRRRGKELLEDDLSPISGGDGIDVTSL